MAAADGKSLFSKIGQWFSKDPPVAVAAFGKCSTANGHQDAAGDATKGMLETARALYYDGALPNCRAWETELRDVDRVLARTVVRWTRDRVYLCRLASIAEGGTETKAFAPLVSCVELDASLALSLLPSAHAELEAAESSLREARPDQWRSVLEPVRGVLRAEAARLGEGLARKGQGSSGSEEMRAAVAALGADASRWIASLAEELNLPLAAPGAETQRPVQVGSRSADAPAIGASAASRGITLGGESLRAGAATEARLWTGLLCAAGLRGHEFWIVLDEEIRFVHLVVGTAKERDLKGLWLSREAAGAEPLPLDGTALGGVAPRVAAWASAHGAVLEALATVRPVAPSIATPPVDAPAADAE